jgi:putative intracellular protease/amidase
VRSPFQGLPDRDEIDRKPQTEDITVISHRDLARRLAAGLSILLVAACGGTHAHDPSSTTPTTGLAAEVSTIDPWTSRFGRQRPVVAVLAVNGNTELTDFVIPYGVLSAADVADVTTVSTGPGPVTMRPALSTQAQMTLDQFDIRYPQGADYVIVPALQPRDDASALRWIKQQAAKGGSTVSICNGALTVAETGLLDGRRATSHWGSEQKRAREYPNVQWQRNIRYVADGRMISSAGVTASMPISIALIAAIAGHARAQATAESLGITDWGPQHNSEVFRHLPLADHGRHEHLQSIGIGLVPGIDEIAFALTAEAYSLTGVSHAYAVASDMQPVRTLRGLTFLPDRLASDPQPIRGVAPGATGQPPAMALDRALDDIKRAYGLDAAHATERVMEYPGFR